ncbi:MAG TPA: tetratricopeptide repeat protein [Silvibacterium sp.]|nr:tetratricopeptide repeat protein [Silvibacterium sp.]
MRIRVAALAVGLSLATYGFATAQVAPLPPGASAAEDAGQAHTEAPLAGIEAAIASKDYGKADGMLDAYLAAHPNDARALFDRGYCEDAQGRVAQAKDFYRKAVAADPKQFEARLALGLILAREGDAGAREQLQAAATLEPNPPNPTAKAQALRALAHLVRQTDPGTAKQALIDALTITPETPEDTLLAAEIAEAAGNDDVAEQAYRRALSVEPQSSAAIAGLAHLLMKEKKDADAEPLLKAALTRDPDDPALNAQYAALLGQEGKSGEALAPLEKLHRLQPKDRGIGEMLADAYVQAGETEKADAVYAELLAEYPDDPDLESAQGQVLIRQRKYAEALDLLQKAVKVRQNDPDAWAGIAFSASKTGQFELVLAALATRSKLAPETPATYFLWATANDSLHRKKQALEYYQLFLKSDSGKFPNEEWQARQRIVVLAK